MKKIIKKDKSGLWTLLSICLVLILIAVIAAAEDAPETQGAQESLEAQPGSENPGNQEGDNNPEEIPAEGSEPTSTEKIGISGEKTEDKKEVEKKETDSLKTEENKTDSAEENKTEALEENNKSGAEEEIKENEDAAKDSTGNEKEGPDIGIQLLHAEKITRGDAIELKALATNKGNLAARNVLIKWELPAEFKIISSNGENCGNLNAGESCAVEIKIQTSLSASLGKNKIKAIVNYENE